MTVAELIERLRAFDPSLPVVVSGFDESGFDMLETIAEVTIVQINDTVGHHTGAYDDYQKFGTGSRGHRPIGEPFKALHLDF